MYVGKHGIQGESISTSPSPLHPPCSNILFRRGAALGREGEEDEEQES